MRWLPKYPFRAGFCPLICTDPEQDRTSAPRTKSYLAKLGCRCWRITGNPAVFGACGSAFDSSAIERQPTPEAGSGSCPESGSGVFELPESTVLYLCFRLVCDPSRRQDIRHVETCDTNPAVSHPIIDIEAIGSGASSTVRTQAEPVATAEPPKAKAGSSSSDATVAEGKTIFDSNRCSGCHGQSGAGGVGPSLTHITAQFLLLS
jgi:hypothetical protein